MSAGFMQGRVGTGDGIDSAPFRFEVGTKQLFEVGRGAKVMPLDCP